MSHKYDFNNFIDAMGLSGLQMPQPFVPGSNPIDLMRKAANALSNQVSMDVVENSKGFHYNMDFPGMKKEDIDIELRDNGFVVSGKRRESKDYTYGFENVSDYDQAESTYHVKERTYGEFNRFVRFPEGVNIDGITASMTDGVLRITFPKVEEKKVEYKKVAIQ